MIAKRVPPVDQRSGKKPEVAAAYGLTVSEFSRAQMDYLQNEGYDGMGNEYETLHDWLTVTHRNEVVDKTPWQKGDDYSL